MTSRARTSLIMLGVVVVAFLYFAPDILLLLFASLLFAIFLRGGGDTVAHLTSLPRGWSLLLFSILLLGLIVALVLTAAPTIGTQVAELASALPGAARSAWDTFRSYSWSGPLLSQMQPDSLLPSSMLAAGALSSTLSKTVGVIGNFVVIVLVGVYLAINPGIYRRGIEALLAPSLRGKALEMLDEVTHTLHGWLLGQFLSMTVIGCLTTAGLVALGVPLAPALGVIAALLTFIPNIGPILSAVPALLLAFAQSPPLALWVAGLYLAVQMVESNFVTPLIQQRTIHLPPAYVFAAQLVFGLLFGVLGLALATPIAAAVLTLTHRLYVDGYLDKEPGPPAPTKLVRPPKPSSEAKPQLAKRK